MKKIIAVIGIAIVLVGGGAYGFKYHERAQLMEAMTPSVKNASIRVTNTAKLQTEKTSITFKELFDRMDSDISEIDRKTIDIQSIANRDNSQLTSPTIQYLKDCQEFSRAVAMKYRKGLALGNAVDRVNDHIDEPMPSSTYGFELRMSRRKGLVNEMNKAAEESTAADADLVSVTKRLKESRSKIAAVYQDDALVAVEQLDAVIKENTPKPKVASENANTKS